MAIKLALGTSHFEKIIEGGYTWIDKSLFVKEVIEDPSEAILITRPRRFGKTLNISMLYHFLSNHPNRISSKAFENLAIAKQAPTLMTEQGKHPTIFISLGRIRGTTLASFISQIQELVRDLYHQFSYLNQSQKLSAEELSYMVTMSSTQPPQDLCFHALYRLTQLLHKHWGQSVWLLIDEFDAPIHRAYVTGYYDEAVELMRSFLCSAIKDNPYLAKCVITGILRVAKESLFSGMNQLTVHSLFGHTYASHFGFTESDAQNLLDESQSNITIESLRSWYNGYRIGSTTLYNPWSIMNAIAYNRLGAYWVNTNDNQLLKDVLTKGHADTRSHLEALLSGEKINVEISEHTPFPELGKDPSMTWNMLFFSGYLTGHPTGMGAIRLPYELGIPNLEVRALIQEIVKTWLHQSLSHADTQLTVNAILTGDAANLELGLGALIRESMSFWDTQEPQPERVYHAFVLGLLVHLKSTYHVRSNRESGYGRYDVMLIPRQPQQPGIVLEFKRCLPDEDLRLGAEDALAQIDKRAYATELLEHGAGPIYALGIAFRGKEVTVASTSKP